MKITPLQCPNCGASLKLKKTQLLIGSTAHCEHCDNDFVLEQDYAAPSYGRTQPVSQASPQRKAIAIFITAAVFALCLLGFILPLSHKISPVPAPTPAIQARTVPASAPVNAFLSLVFGKPAKDVTKEEIASIQYLDIRIDDYYTPGSYEPWRGENHGLSDIWAFTYSFEDYFAGNAGFEDSLDTVFVPKTTSSSIDWEDMQCFTGLTWLDANRCSDIHGSGRDVSLAGLKKLKHFGCGFNQDAAEMSELLPDPAQIRSLGIGLRSQRDVEALAKFTNLEQLSLNYVVGEDIENINQISVLKNLKSLTLHLGENISWLSVLPGLTSLTLATPSVSDYSVLYGMPALEELNILHASDLQEIGFVRSMPKLRSLHIRLSDIISIEPLRGSIALQSLHLESNHDLKNADALATLTSLQALSIDSSVNAFPSLSALSHLRSASLCAENLSAITKLQAITDLQVFGDWPLGELDCTQLTKFPNVHTLLLSEIDTVKNFAALRKMASLKTLRLFDISLSNAASFSEVFNLPKLEKLELQDCYVAIDTALLSPAASLRHLRMVDCGSWRFFNGGTKLQEYAGAAPLTAVLRKMTQLQTLELPEAMLEDISFAAALKELEVLNIAGNYITDAAALSELPKLRLVFCTKNPVQNLAILPKAVRVYA